MKTVRRWMDDIVSKWQTPAQALNQESTTPKRRPGCGAPIPFSRISFREMAVNVVCGSLLLPILIAVASRPKTGWRTLATGWWIGWSGASQSKAGIVSLDFRAADKSRPTNPAVHREPTPTASGGALRPRLQHPQLSLRDFGPHGFRPQLALHRPPPQPHTKAARLACGPGCVQRQAAKVKISASWFDRESHPGAPRASVHRTQGLLTARGAFFFKSRILRTI